MIRITTPPRPLLLLLLLLSVLTSCGSRRSQHGSSPMGAARIGSHGTNSAYNQYIDKYSTIALESQRKFGIPASIVLAQGLLESGAGRSKLATQANNHFGIKCHRSWTGGRSYHTDDAPNECFRSYSSVLDSYVDHGHFLTNQKRYQSLFRLEPTDYKGWARGLQSAGYATDRGYANKLIKIIEDYRLYLVDDSNVSRDYAYNQPRQRPRQVSSQSPIRYERPATSASQPKGRESSRQVRQTYISYGLLYTLALDGDDLGSIARDFEMSERKLTRYNDFPEGYPVTAGTIIYLQPKLKQATPPHYEHRVKVGESIHDIAQRYGLQLSALYKLNKLSPEYIPSEGDLLILR